MSRLLDRRDGYYDDEGQWQWSKFCFRSCGDRCTCGPPMGRWYAREHDKSKPQHERGFTQHVSGWKEYHDLIRLDGAD